MPAIGDLTAKIILAKTVRLFSDVDTDNTADDELTLMRGLRGRSAMPKQRTDIGKGRLYSYGAPDVELFFTVAASEDLFAELNKWHTQDSDGNLPTKKWQVRLTSIDGTTKNLSFEGDLYVFEFEKGTGDQAQTIPCNCQVQIVGENYVVS